MLMKDNRTGAAVSVQLDEANNATKIKVLCFNIADILCHLVLIKMEISARDQVTRCIID